MEITAEQQLLNDYMYLHVHGHGLRFVSSKAASSQILLSICRLHVQYKARGVCTGCGSIVRSTSDPNAHPPASILGLRALLSLRRPLTKEQVRGVHFPAQVLGMLDSGLFGGEEAGYFLPNVARAHRETLPGDLVRLAQLQASLGLGQVNQAPGHQANLVQPQANLRPRPATWPGRSRDFPRRQFLQPNQCVT